MAVPVSVTFPTQTSCDFWGKKTAAASSCESPARPSRHEEVEPRQGGGAQRDGATAGFYLAATAEATSSQWPQFWYSSTSWDSITTHLLLVHSPAAAQQLEARLDGGGPVGGTETESGGSEVSSTKIRRVSALSPSQGSPLFTSKF